MTDVYDDDEDRDPIVGKVVEVISNREVLINVGSEDGVELGMEFDILGSVKVDSQRAPGGSLDVPFLKRVVKVVRFVEDKHSVARTFKVIKGRPATPGPLASLVSPSLRSLEGSPAVPDRVETLNLDDQTRPLLETLPPETKAVRIGDRVEEDWGDDY